MRLSGISRGLQTGQKPLVSLLRPQRRAYRAAIIGGGITGLTSAYELAREPGCDHITIYEKSSRLGGWLESETIPVDGGHVLFEYGPRTLRNAWPASQALVFLIAELGLLDDMIVTPKRSPAALNRFIYYPDHLVRLPTPRPRLSFRDNAKSMINTLTREPLFEGFVPGVLFEHFRPPRPYEQWQEDESVADFISRRFHPKMADNLVSAMMHGIYAGDIDKLSAQTLLGPLRNLEAVGVVSGLFSQTLGRRKTRNMDDLVFFSTVKPKDRVEDLIEEIELVATSASTFTLKGGTQQLVEALERSLEETGKVKIMTNTEVSSISQTQDSNLIHIQTAGNAHQSYDGAIATLPAPALAKTLAPTKSPRQRVPLESIGKLQEFNYATTVMVVNLYYSNPNLLPMEGFGYLIPRSIPVDQNPECGLGVIFASSSSVGVSGTIEREDVSQDTAPGTKLTVMMGGHYWDGWKETDYPDHDSAVGMARTMLARHLDITEKPAVARSRLQRDAIPQYTVGHLDRMYALSDAVRSDFQQQLVIAGNWYTGVGVGDCVRQGFLAATLGLGWKGIERDVPERHRKRLPWLNYNVEEWEFRGGIPTAPVRLVQTYG